MDKIFQESISRMHAGIKERALPAGGWSPAPDAGDDLIVHKDYLIQITPPLRYVLEDIASFTAYCKKIIDPEQGIIFYTKENLVGIHDRLKPAGNRACYNSELSPELRAWKNVINYSHKQFRKFIEERLGELVDQEIFTALATLKMNTEIHFESDFEDDRNYGFVYEERAGKGCSKIPKEFDISVPFFANDPPQTISLRLDVPQPKSSEARASFNVEIIKEVRLLVDNVAKLIARLRTDLPAFMILNGNP